MRRQPLRGLPPEIRPKVGGRYSRGEPGRADYVGAIFGLFAVLNALLWQLTVGPAATKCSPVLVRRSLVVYIGFVGLRARRNCRMARSIFGTKEGLCCPLALALPSPL
jgi:hypothetical protein